MTALDTDLLSDLLSGRRSVIDKADEVGPSNLAVPITAAEEILKGWMAEIARSRESRDRIDLPRAYARLERTIFAVAEYVILPYTATAQAKFLEWRAARIRIGTRDLRIAAICVAHDIELATRNRRDFDKVPGLKLSVWN